MNDGSADAPRITFVVAAHDAPFVTTCVLPSLSIGRQREVTESTYEILLVDEGPESVITPSLLSLGVDARVLPGVRSRDWKSILRAARGEIICALERPGVASPMLASILCAAIDAYPNATLVVPTVQHGTARPGGLAEWLSRYGLPLGAQIAIIPQAGETPSWRWLEPIQSPENFAVARWMPQKWLASDSDADPFAIPSERVQLIGAALIRPTESRQPAVEARRSTASGGAVDPQLTFFGLMERPGRLAPCRPLSFVRRHRPKLSVVVVTHNMRREAPRTLRSLQAGYQRGIAADEFEVIVVDNGSQQPMSEAEVEAVAPGASYHVLVDASPSPARAINHGVSHSSGDALALMIDGACLLSPGVLVGGLAAWRSFPRPIVVTRYFYLGPGEQLDTVPCGYDQRQEDELLERAKWTEDGYRLFEVSSPLTFGGSSAPWLLGWFESNCLFLPRAVFEEIGGCDERFDMPGGGYLNPDLLYRACNLQDVQPVQLLGEGTFHQVHGGVTTNTTRADLERKDHIYTAQYIALRGEMFGDLPRNFYFTGKLRTPACRWKMID